MEDLSLLILLIAMLIGKTICMVPYGPKTSKADVKEFQLSKHHRINEPTFCPDFVICVSDPKLMILFRSNRCSKAFYLSQRRGT